MQIGIVAFFIKPFNDEKFLAAVRDALNLAAAALAHTVASANPR
jgi:FixJ family two-component response regulator